LESNLEVLSNKRIIEAGEAVDVSHHARWPVEDLKEVSKKFLSPATNLVNGPVVFQDFLDDTAIAKPVKFSPPKKLAVLTNRPAPEPASPTNEWKWRSRSVQLREPKRTGRRRAPFIVRSKVLMPSALRRARATREALEFSGCIRIQPMPVPAQSVFKKQGREESYRARQGEEVMVSLSSSQR
jgi:hypothetical protein